MLEPRFLIVALRLVLCLFCACACTSDSALQGGKAGSAANGGSGGSGGKGGASGKPSNGAGSGATGDSDASVDEPAAGSGGGAGKGGTGGIGGRGGSGGIGGRAGDGSGESGSSGGGEGGSSGSAGGAGDAAGSGSADPSAALFDPDVLQRFDITLPEASIAALNASSDVYTYGSLDYGNTTLADIGVRIKGEASRRNLTQKAAFKLKLDEYVADQRLLGLNRITLNNMLADATFMAECLSYAVYRAAGLPAPRCNHALVYVNGEFFGVYANIESEDKTFLRRWFTDEDGNLYEDGMSDFVAGSESSFDLQTNETANDRSDLTSLISAIDSAESSTYLTDLDSILDTAQYLRFTAVEAAVNQWDGYSYTYFEPNNFRIYHDPTTRKFTFIPWGHDLAMKAFPNYGDNSPPVRSFIPLFTAPVYENVPTARDAGGRIFVGDRSGNPGRAMGGCLGSASCRSEFASAVSEVIAVYDGLALPEMAARMYTQIREHVLAETRKEVSNEDFEAAYQALLQHLAMRTDAMRSDLTAAGLSP